MTTAAAALPTFTLPTRMLNDAPIFTRAGLFLALLLIPLALAAGIDPREIEGASVWVKPAKFAAALSLYLLTLAWYARFASDAFNRHRGTRAFHVVVVLAVALEMAWIGGAAMWGTTSQFNIATPAMSAIYSLMGALAVTLTAAALVLGVALWRRGAGWPVTLGASLVATFVATVIVAGYMSQTGGHHVGTPLTGATLPLMGWSREVGDLRVPHFLATHILHMVPLAALALQATGRAVTPRTGLMLTGAAMALTVAAFAQALRGAPVI